MVEVALPNNEISDVIQSPVPELEGIDEATLDLVASNRQLYKPSGNRASEIGNINDCLRRLVYARTHWDQRKLPSPSLAGIFETGKEVEQVDLRNLSRIGRDRGFEVVESQKSMSWDEYQIVGHCDGLISVNNEIVAGLEIKSVGYRYGSLNSIESLMSWDIAAKWFGQAQIYMLLSNNPHWLMRLVSKVNLWDTRSLWLTLDLEYAEQVLKHVESINRHIKEGILPDRTDDTRKCERCDFAHLCLPELDYSQNTMRITAPDVIDARARVNDLAKTNLEYNRMDRLIKSAVKSTLPEPTLETVGQQIIVEVGDEKIVYVGRQRTTKPSQGGTTFNWQQDKKATKDFAEL